MALSDIVSVTITSSTAGVTQAGFGVPLILSVNATFTERVRFYTSLAGVGADFATTTPEYLAASAIFAQSPAPSRIAVGRRALKPTQDWRISLAAAPTAGEVYSLTVGSTAVSVTAGSGTFCVNDTVIAQLVAAIGSVTGYTVSAAGTGGSKYVKILSNTAGNFLNVNVDDVGKLLVEQVQADPGIATDLAAIYLEDSTWYCVLDFFPSEAEGAALAAWVESNEKMCIIATNQSTICTVASAGATDLAKDLATSAYARTAVIYQSTPSDFADCAWAGKCLPYDPGEETWKFKTLAGVAADTFTATHETNLNAKKCNYYTTVGGVNITMGTPGGTTASGEYIDVIRFRDWLKARIAERIYGRLVNSAKIQFTDAGIAVIEAEIRAQLKEGIEVGGLAASPAPTVTVPAAADVSANDKAARRLTGVTFTATLAGAIHVATITGTVTL